MGPVRDLEDLLSLLGDGRLAVGLLGAVPAGIYAQQAFERLGWLDRIQPKLAQADNVRNVLALVVRGEAKMGVVYKSDLLASPGLAVLKVFSGDSHDPIIYPAALTKKAGLKAGRFLEFLMSEDGQQILAKHGFQPIGQDR
jgi:molybdenum ABC transporter, periplasmic molybdate-binding protein